MLHLRRRARQKKKKSRKVTAGVEISQRRSSLTVDCTLWVKRVNLEPSCRVYDILYYPLGSLSGSYQGRDAIMGLRRYFNRGKGMVKATYRRLYSMGVDDPLDGSLSWLSRNPPSLAGPLAMACDQRQSCASAFLTDEGSRKTAQEWVVPQVPNDSRRLL